MFYGIQTGQKLGPNDSSSFVISSYNSI